MKLDRNINRGGGGKYALVNMRKLLPLLDKEAGGELSTEEIGTLHCFRVLVQNGVITLGNESPGEQFFVMKYKDKFTAPALIAYANAVRLEAVVGDGLWEYANQIRDEALKAQGLGVRIPD